MLRIVPHIPQLYDWDCGVAAVSMVLHGLGLCNEERKIAELYQLVHPTHSIWTIDLAYCLRQFGVQDFTMFTTYIGVNWNHVSTSKTGFYRKDSLSHDLKRVHSLFARAQSAHVRVVPFLLALDDLQRFLLSRRYAVIVLVDLQKLSCLQCDSPFLATNISIPFPLKKMKVRRNISGENTELVRKERERNVVLDTGLGEGDESASWISGVFGNFYTRFAPDVITQQKREVRRKGKERQMIIANDGIETDEIQPLLTQEDSSETLVVNPQSFPTWPSSSRPDSNPSASTHHPTFMNLPYFGSQTLMKESKLYIPSKPTTSSDSANSNNAIFDTLSLPTSPAKLVISEQDPRSASPSFVQPLLQLFSNVTPPRTPLRGQPHMFPDNDDESQNATNSSPEQAVPPLTELGSDILMSPSATGSAASSELTLEHSMIFDKKDRRVSIGSPIYPIPRHPGFSPLYKSSSPIRPEPQLALSSSPSRQSSLPDTLSLIDRQKRPRVSSESDVFVSTTMKTRPAIPSAALAKNGAVYKSVVEERVSCMPPTTISDFFARICGGASLDEFVSSSKSSQQVNTPSRLPTKWSSARTNTCDFTVKLPAPLKTDSQDSGFVGHYIVLIGYDPKKDVFYYRDPGTNESLCLVSSKVLEAARSAPGTDHDAIVVKIL